MTLRFQAHVERLFKPVCKKTARKLQEERPKMFSVYKSVEKVAEMFICLFKKFHFEVKFPVWIG
jgi:hypothetical protein